MEDIHKLHQNNIKMMINIKYLLGISKTSNRKMIYNSHYPILTLTLMILPPVTRINMKC